MSHESPSGPMPPAQPSVLGLNQVGRADEVRPPRPDEALSANACRDDRRISVEFLTLAVIAALALAWVGGTHFVTNGLPSFGNGAVKAIVERIIAVESDGDSNARNKRSSATGAGQFLDETWLEMIRTYPRDHDAMGGAECCDVEEARPSSHAGYSLPHALCRSRGSPGRAVRLGKCRRGFTHGERRRDRPDNA